MAEFKRDPIISYDREYKLITFTEDHTFADIIRWLRSEGWDESDTVDVR